MRIGKSHYGNFHLKSSRLLNYVIMSRYPGVRCDVPSHCYQYTFESNTQWPEYYSEGKEILEYFKRTAKKFGVYKYIKFNHVLKGANWDADAGKWHVDLEDTTNGNVSSIGVH